MYFLKSNYLLDFYVPLNAVLTEGKLNEDSRVSGKVFNVKEINFEKLINKYIVNL